MGTDLLRARPGSRELRTRPRAPPLRCALIAPVSYPASRQPRRLAAHFAPCRTGRRRGQLHASEPTKPPVTTIVATWPVSVRSGQTTPPDRPVSGRELRAARQRPAAGRGATGAATSRTRPRARRSGDLERVVQAGGCCHPSSTPALSSVAYTSATATALFDIDTLGDRVSLQSPANTGTFAPTGNLGVNVGPDAGFDIYFSPKHGTNQGFATLNTSGVARSYAIDVLTGTARELGAFPQRNQVTDLALLLDQH
nr:DUF4394 domain-containing protein [Streptomyces sp. CS-7]